MQENKKKTKARGNHQENLIENGEDPSNVLQWDAVSCVLLKLWLVEFIARKNNKLASIMALLKNPATVCYLVLQELIQRETFNVDGL